MALITLLWSGFLVYYIINKGASNDWVVYIPINFALVGLIASAMLLLSLSLIFKKNAFKNIALKKANLWISVVANTLVYAIPVSANLTGSLNAIDEFFVIDIFIIQPLCHISYLIVLVILGIKTYRAKKCCELPVPES